MPKDQGNLLQTAESILISRPDSALKILKQIEYPNALPHEQLMLYGRIQARAHHACGISMSEDSLLLPAADYFLSKGDSDRIIDIFLAKASYYRWTQQYDKIETAIDTAIIIAQKANDSLALANLLYNMGSFYTEYRKDFSLANQYMKEALQYADDQAINFSLGINLGLIHHDSSSYYMDRAIELALAKKDTDNACHYLRNYAQILTMKRQPSKAIELVKRTMKLRPTTRQKGILYSTLGENYLRMGQLDSAQHYVTLANKCINSLGSLITHRNMIAQYQMLIDYARTKNFDNITINRFNDSIGNALYYEKNTIRQKNESKALLERERLQMDIERQHTQIVLLITLFILISTGGGAAFYIHNRRNRLVETEERMEALTKLLNDATKSKKEGAEDEYFFKKILLQQLGIIRMVAAQPTIQNQEMLRRISGISNKEIPAESLLAWEDLYPLIDKIYNGFYTLIKQKYGVILLDKEVQLCCLLCAEFSTKEISVVTQQSIPTIYQRKTNIRKKLGMDEKEDIIDFIRK